MSYEQKYLKYKQKYVELKDKIEVLRQQKTGNIIDENTVNEYNLSETPNFQNLTGGSIKNIQADNDKEVDMSYNETQNFDLTDTPTMNQSGGYFVDNVNTAPFTANGTGIPNTSECKGNVNPQPNTQPNPKLATENSTLNNVEKVPQQPPKAESVKPEAINNKIASLTDELNTTTDISDANATDVNTIFSQLGGHRDGDRDGDRDGGYSNDIDDITLGDSSSSFSSSSSTEEFGTSLSVSDVDNAADGLFNF